MMNENKVAFIICINDDNYAQECIYYINHLYVPDNFVIDVITIKEAEHITEAYHTAMMSSDAKYKVYLHQDVFILNKNLIYDFLKIFQNSQIGMIGVLGKRPPGLVNAEFHSMWDIGNCMVTGIHGCGNVSAYYEKKADYDIAKVFAVDGMFMVTQYDIPWKKGIAGWHFYDISHCIEMQKHGYQIVVPFQKDVWILHDAMVNSLKGYDKARERFCNLYRGDGFVYDLDKERDSQYDEEMEKYQRTVECLERGEIGAAKEQFSKVETCVDRKMLILKRLFEIREAELSHYNSSQIFCCNLQGQVQEFYHVAFLLRRIAFGFPTEESQELIDMLLTKKVTSEFIIHVLQYQVFFQDGEWVLENIIGRC